jgi:hypothetical protein
MLKRKRAAEKDNISMQPFTKVRLLQNAPFCPISVLGSNFNPQKTLCIPVVKILAFLELEQK